MNCTQVVGCPPGTVRSRIHYGKQALQRLLGPPEHDASRFNRRETTKR